MLALFSSLLLSVALVFTPTKIAVSPTGSRLALAVFIHHFTAFSAGCGALRPGGIPLKIKDLLIFLARLYYFQKQAGELSHLSPKYLGNKPDRFCNCTSGIGLS
jgi:hypothetical protein